MKTKTVSPDREKARLLLARLWEQVLAETEPKLNPNIDKLIGSKLVSIRFCLPTQLLGKATDPRLDSLCLQLGSVKNESHWDPREFAKKVICPWVAEHQNVLGASSDPYVSNPLRIPQLKSDPGAVKGKDDWKLLYKILKDVQDKNKNSYTIRRLTDALRSIKRKLDESSFEFVLPERVSLDQTLAIVVLFLSEGSGGDRGLAVATALFKTFGSSFSLYSEVRRHAINASDKSTGQTADIECFDLDGKLRLAIEVKERSLTLTDVRDGITKARRTGIAELLFNAPRTNPKENDQIEKLIETTWASGTNLYRLSIEELIMVGLTLAGEEGRKDFLTNIGNQLNEYNTQPSNRVRWKAHLDAI